MRCCLWLTVPFALVGFLACVGDDPNTTFSSKSNDGGPGGGDGANQIDGGGSLDGSATDPDGGDDAGPRCGYPGEDCCTGPLSACRAGTVCSTDSNTCKVNDAWAIGEYSFINTSIPAFGERYIAAHYDGTEWKVGPEPKNPFEGVANFHLTAVFEAGEGNVRIVGNANNDKGGKVLGLHGSNWEVCGIGKNCKAPLGTKLPEFYDVIAVDGEYWLGGFKNVSRCSDAETSCTPVVDGLPASWGFGNFSGTSDKDLWAAALDKAFHFDGTSWRVHSGVDAVAIHRIREKDVWAGGTHLQHWDGTEWSALYNVGAGAAPGTINGISGPSSDDVWAVGAAAENQTFVAHWDGTAWSIVTIPTHKYGQRVWAPSKSDAFIGGETTVLRWNGTEWSPMTLPTVTPGANEELGAIRWIDVRGAARPRP